MSGSPRDSGAPTRRFRPPRRRGVLFGLALTLAGLLVGAAAGLSFWQRYPEPGAVPLAGVAVATAAAAVVAGLWTLGLASLVYEVAASAVTVRWLGVVFWIPLDDRAAVLPGAAAGPLRDFRGLAWPGCAIGRCRLADSTEAVLLATDRRLDRLIFVVTPAGTVGLSTAGSDRLAEAIAEQCRRRPVESARAEAVGWRRQAIWSDGVFWGAAGLAGVVLLAGWAIALERQAGFPAGGWIFLGTLRLDNPGDLPALIGVGAGIWAMDFAVGAIVHAWEPVAARALAVTGGTVQAIIVVALLTIGG